MYPFSAVLVSTIADSMAGIFPSLYLHQCSVLSMVTCKLWWGSLMCNKESPSPSLVLGMNYQASGKISWTCKNTDPGFCAPNSSPPSPPPHLPPPTPPPQWHYSKLATVEKKTALFLFGSVCVLSFSCELLEHLHVLLDSGTGIKLVIWEKMSCGIACVFVEGVHPRRWHLLCKCFKSILS